MITAGSPALGIMLMKRLPGYDMDGAGMLTSICILKGNCKSLLGIIEKTCILKKRSDDGGCS